jgi:hypothetical protein
MHCRLPVNVLSAARHYAAVAAYVWWRDIALYRRATPLLLAPCSLFSLPFFAPFFRSLGTVCAAG